MANLAFALGSNPGIIQEDDFQKFITTLGVTDPQEILALRRLTFEAQTMLISSLKQEVSRPSASSSETKHMSPLERQSRIDALRAKTAGVTIKGEYEPSHGLIDACLSMIDQPGFRPRWADFATRGQPP